MGALNLQKERVLDTREGRPWVDRSSASIGIAEASQTVSLL